MKVYKCKNKERKREKEKKGEKKFILQHYTIQFQKVNKTKKKKLRVQAKNGGERSNLLHNTTGYTHPPCDFKF